MKKITKSEKYNKLLNNKKYLKIINKELNIFLAKSAFISLVVFYLIKIILTGSDLWTVTLSVKLMMFFVFFLMISTVILYSYTSIKSKIEIKTGVYKISFFSGVAVEKMKSHAGIHKVRFFINDVSENSTIPINSKKKLDDFLIKKYKKRGMGVFKDGVFMIIDTTYDVYKKVPINKLAHFIVYEPLGLLISFESDVVVDE